VTDADDWSSDEAHLPRYTVRVVARRMGVPTATLRSWSQRYGVGPASHTPGQHRLYSEADVAMVHKMQSLISHGATPRSAAQSALDNVLPASTNAAQLLDAALNLDAAEVGRLLDSHIRRHGVVDAWERLIRPAFATIDGWHAESKGCIDVEHVLSWTVTRSLQWIPSAASEAPPAILLCCTERETHTLALEALRCALAEHRCPALTLGATTPTSAVLDALARRPSPATVVLFAQRRRNADMEAAQTIAGEGAHVVLAGPGWDDAGTPAGAVRVNTLDEALRHLLDSSGWPPPVDDVHAECARRTAHP
jgi:DNA-binding transcriptional MerR regulator